MKCGVEWEGLEVSPHTQREHVTRLVCACSMTHKYGRAGSGTTYSSDSEKTRQQVRQTSGFFFLCDMQWMKQEKSARTYDSVACTRN